MYNLLMISTTTCCIKMQSPCFQLLPGHHYGMHILVQMYMDVQLDGRQIKIKENSLVYIIRWMLKKGTHLLSK
jgi:hypothetical protein